MRYKIYIKTKFPYEILEGTKDTYYTIFSKDQRYKNNEAQIDMNIKNYLQTNST